MLTRIEYKYSNEEIEQDFRRPYGIPELSVQQITTSMIRSSLVLTVCMEAYLSSAVHSSKVGVLFLRSLVLSFVAAIVEIER